MTDSVVQVSSGSGPNVDVSEITRDDASVAERQRINISDPEDPNAHASVRGESGRGKLEVGSDQMLAELKKISRVLEEIRDVLLLVTN